MLGWEFPPHISGGLGTACHGLVKALSAAGIDTLFVLPRPAENPCEARVELVDPPAPAVPEVLPHVTFRTVEAAFNPYQRPREFESSRSSPTGATLAHPEPPTTAAVVEPIEPPLYGTDLFGEVQRYAAHAMEATQNESFDIIHAHDWMTFPAGLAIAAVTGVPLVVHVHSTEIDRVGEHLDQRIYDIERRGMHGAMRVIAVSSFTKDRIVRDYGIEPHKVDVVYNAVESHEPPPPSEEFSIRPGEKVVLFLGRITMQKGPEYFLAAAKKVLEVMDDVKFVMAGSGDMLQQAVELAAEFGIGHKVLFTGFLRGPDVERIFQMADLYVMPSVSEPFGIAPLEAIANDVPVLISRQSGVSEVLPHALKVDFWDTHEMANKIVAVLRHPPLALMLREQGTFELSKLSWDDSARACIGIYKHAIQMMR
ncbi:MAG: glycosyltransferase family 4 protein [Tepidisphaeraceae bacterium]